MSFTDRTRAILEDRNISINKMLKDLGLGSGAFASWEANGRYPRADIVSKISDYLGVSVDYLLGRDEAEKKPAGEDAGGLDAMQLELLEAFSRLPDPMKQTFLRKIRDDAEFYGLPPTKE